MDNSLVPLKSLPKLDTQGWNVPFQEILTPQRDIYPFFYPFDRLYEDVEHKYACLMYTITEFSMGSYTGLLAIFENKEQPRMIGNPKYQWFSYNGDRTAFLVNDFLFVRLEAYHQDKSLSGWPFVAFNLKEKRFGFIDFNASSIYYSITPVSDTTYKFHLDSPDHIDNRRFINRHGSEFDVKGRQFYDFSLLDSMVQLYHKEKSEEQY